VTTKLGAAAAVAVVPTGVDVGLLVLLRQGFGWPLIVADLSAIAVASVVSYLLHRITTYRSNPYFRWVRHPSAFAVLALVAAVVDALVLRLTFTAAGYTTVTGLLVAKALSLTSAAAVRALGYRYVLSEVVNAGSQHRTTGPPSDGELRLSIVLPAYGESGRIGATVASVRRELGDVAASGGLEVIVVDDGSGDGTADEALAAGADQVVELPANRGKGAAVRAGMLSTRGRVAAFVDADLAYHPAHLRRILVEIEDGWDVVIGNRRHPESEVEAGSGLRSAGSRVVNRLASIVLLAAPLDTQCGLKGFRGDVARRLFRHTRVDGFAFDIEVLHLVERSEMSLREIPVRLVDPGGGSTVRVLADVSRLLRDLFRVRYWSSTGQYDGLEAAVPA
jgi:dolichyl-phosphate beta-glucosyltransferase